MCRSPKSPEEETSQRVLKSWETHANEAGPQQLGSQDRSKKLKHPPGYCAESEEGLLKLDISCEAPACDPRMAEPQGQELTAECPVCWNPFNNTFHTPKVLDCCHSFCVECLAHLSLVAPARRRLLCPLCRQPTVLASGQPVTDLPTDTAMLTLLRLEPHHVILEGHQLCLKDQPKSRYLLRQPRVYTLDLGTEPGSQTGPPQDTVPDTRPVPIPIPSHYSLRECIRNPHFRIFAYLMAVILSVTLLLIFSIFWTKQFFWGVG
ncbi:E3 ubiquitin-protein ligase RNF183 [Cricetulus griseus]|uniref:E3 ubiquitin-protein ligase RNF183 n=1 Tax=Cricetulus griseus TaxID=10029 RepID=A0A9J7JG41_CRIGR|nr:E3 ubiquitin-protein ligase RNF183 [Cricetulus griseus]XP_027293133.1 E3 ubiquitin-protein ligase RNF183 [Cricetulus griseus]